MSPCSIFLCLHFPNLFVLIFWFSAASEMAWGSFGDLHEGSVLLHCLLHRILPRVLSRNSGHSNDGNSTSAQMWLTVSPCGRTFAFHRESAQIGQRRRIPLTVTQSCRLSESQRAIVVSICRYGEIPAAYHTLSLSFQPNGGLATH